MLIKEKHVQVSAMRRGKENPDQNVETENFFSILNCKDPHFY